MKLINTKDIFEIAPNKQFTDLKKSDKFKLMDRLLNPEDESKRGLNVEFGLSVSGRRTNNRIYTPRGQRAGIDSWTSPYQRPIIRNHDVKEDPLGRITDVRWESLDNKAIKRFKRIQDYMAVKDAMESDDPKRIYSVMRKYNLLTDKNWTGTGELIATASIMDEAAIEKFIDGRYLTFSAGATTDRWICSACHSNWSTGDVCDHRPGQITEDGELVVMITGTYYGREASVLNTPASDFSTVRNIEFGDGLEQFNVDDSFLTDTSTIYLTDSFIVDAGELMPADKKTVEQLVEELKAMDARDIARNLFAGTFTPEQNDALEAASHYETSWLIRIHDALHREHDWALRYGDSAELPAAVFRMHGALHMLSDEKGFRDSLINGDLDGFDSAGKESEEYRMKSTEDASEQTDLEALATMIKKVVEATPELADALQPSKEELVDAVGEAGEVEDEAQPTSVDWTLLDMAMTLELGDKALSAEDREALSEESFAGPDRKFPMATADHVEAMRSLLEKVTVDEKIRADLEARAEKLLADSAEAPELVELRKAHDELKADYEQVLGQVQELKDQLAAAQASSEEPEPADTQDQSQDEAPESTIIQDVEKGSLEDPNGSSGESLSSKPSAKVNDEFQSLDAYQKNVVARYLELRDSCSAEVADAHLLRLRRRGYLSHNFDVTQYIQEND